MTDNLPTVSEGKSQSSLGIYFVGVGGVFAGASASIMLAEAHWLLVLAAFFVGLISIIWGAARDDLWPKLQQRRQLDREIKAMRKELKQLRAAIDDIPAPDDGTGE